MLDVHRFELGPVNHVLIVHSVGGALRGSVSFFIVQNGPMGACAEQRMRSGGIEPSRRRSASVSGCAANLLSSLQAARISRHCQPQHAEEDLQSVSMVLKACREGWLEIRRVRRAARHTFWPPAAGEVACAA